MKFRYLIILLSLIFIVSINGQETDHGSSIYRARNVHAGNLIRLTFYNFGMVGVQNGDQSSVFTGEWPINSGLVQLGNASAFVMTEMHIPVGDGHDSVVTPAVFCQGWDPNLFSHDSLGVFLGFEPLPGYLTKVKRKRILSMPLR
jgi:hypothetical protein